MRDQMQSQYNVKEDVKSQLDDNETRIQSIKD